MEAYHKIQTLFKRDMDGSLTGKKGKMMEGQWTTPELEYLADKKWEWTEKVDGTNIRVNFGPWANPLQGEVFFGGRSDNAVIPKPLLQYLEATFSVELFNENELNDITLYGEGYGPKIQNGGNYRDDISFVLFDVKIGPWWLDRANVDDIAAKLGIDSVPFIGHGSLYQAINYVKYGAPYFDEEVASIKSVSPDDWIGKGFLKSQWGDFEAEGIVARPAVPLFDRKGQRIITKIKGVDFK